MGVLRRYPHASMAALLGLAILATFGTVAGNSMFLASADSVHRLPLLSSWRHLPAVFSSDFLMFSDGKLRPLSYGLIALARTVVEADSIGIWHLLLLLIHWANALLLTRIVHHFTGGLGAPLFAGLLFALHPLASVVANDAGLLHHLLTPTLGLASLHFYLRSEQRERTPVRYALSLGLFAGGLLVSKVAFTIPVLLAAFEGIYLRSGWRRTTRALVPFVAIGLVVSPLWWLLRPHPLHFSYIVFPPGATWFTMFSVISATEWYARGLLLGSGIPVALHEVVPQIYELTSWRLAFLSAVVAAVLLSGVALMRRRHWGGLGLVAIVVAMIPYASCSWHNAHDYVSWKYLYTPLAGLALFLGWVFQRLGAGGRARVGAVLWLVLPLFAWQQVRLNQSMASPVAYWSRVTHLNPHSEVGHVELGKAYLVEEEEAEARAHLFAPAVKQLYTSASSMCRYYATQGEYLPAAIHLRMALRRGQGLQFGHGDHLRMALRRGQGLQFGHGEPLMAELMHGVRAYDHAEGALGKVLTSNPYDIGAMERLAAIWCEKGYIKAAEKLLDRVRQLDPAAGEASRMQATLATRRDDSWQTSVIQPPTPSWLRYATQGTPDAQMKAEIIQLSDRYPDDPVIQLEAASCLAKDEDHAGALVRFERVTEALPNSALSWAMRAWTAMESGKVEEAMYAGRRALELDNRNATVHNTLGILSARRAAQRQGDTALSERAIEHFREALRLNPLHTSAYVNLGKELVRRGQVDQAMTLYRRAVRLRPDFPEAHFNMGNLAASQGNHPEAIKSYHLALRARRHYVEAHFNLGLSHAQQGNLEAASASFRQALEIRPEFVRARDALATALLQQGAYGECMAALKEGLGITPQHWRGALMLSSLLTSCPDASLRDPGAAVALAEAASEALGHADPDVLLVLAGAQAEAGNLDDAVATGRRAVRLAAASRQPGQAARARAGLNGLLERRQQGEPR